MKIRLLLLLTVAVGMAFTNFNKNLVARPGEAAPQYQRMHSAAPHGPAVEQSSKARPANARKAGR